MEYVSNTTDEMRQLFADIVFMMMSLAFGLYQGFVIDLQDTLKILVKARVETDINVNVTIASNYTVAGLISMLAVGIYMTKRP